MKIWLLLLNLLLAGGVAHQTVALFREKRKRSVDRTRLIGALSVQGQVKTILRQE